VLFRSRTTHTTKIIQVITTRINTTIITKTPRQVMITISSTTTTTKPTQDMRPKTRMRNTQLRSLMPTSRKRKMLTIKDP